VANAAGNKNTADFACSIKGRRGTRWKRVGSAFVRRAFSNSNLKLTGYLSGRFTVCSIVIVKVRDGCCSPLRQIGAFEKSNVWQGRLDPRATARWAVELFGPAFRVGIAGVEVLGALVLKLSDGSATGGDSLHDHGSFLAKAR
jgi:hypothetical protein